MLSCAECRELLPALAADLIDDDAADADGDDAVRVAAARTHLAECAPCAAELAVLAGAFAALADAEPPAPPERIWDGIAEAIADDVAAGTIAGAAPAAATPATSATRPPASGGALLEGIRVAAALLIGAAIAAAVSMALTVAPSSGDRAATREPRIERFAAGAVVAHLGAAAEIASGVTPDGSVHWVELHRGAARFIVTPGTPFEVRTPVCRVTVIGTVFDVILHEGDLIVGPTIRYGLAAGVGVASTFLAFVAVEAGRVEVHNDHGVAVLDEGEAAVTTLGSMPTAIADVAAERDALRVELDTARSELTETRTELAALRAEMAAASAGETDGEASGGAGAEGPSSASGDAEHADGDQAPNPIEVQELFEELGKGGIFAMQSPKMKDLVRAIKALGDEGVAMAGRWLLDSDDVGQRFIAAALFEGLGDEAAVPYLTQALGEDDSFVVRRMASHALAVNAFEGGTEALWSAAEGDADWGVKANSLYGLGKMGDETGIDRLTELWMSEETPAQHKLSLYGGLADIASPRSYPVFERVLTESSEVTELLVTIRAVATLGDERILPTLERLIANDAHDGTITESAKKAYNEIVGHEAYPSGG